MPSAPTKPRARIDPPWKLVFPGLGWHFALEVDGRPAEASWVVSHPDVGRVVKETGEFRAHEGFRLPRTDVVAITRDARHVARAAVHVMVGPLPTDGPIPVDDYRVHPGLRSLRWNDLHGRRAVLLMTETLMQLPREFLDAVGPVAVLRVPGAGIGGAAGMHLPFPQRVVLISDTDRVMSLHPESGEFTDEDYHFVETFIHELAHVALANAALPDRERTQIIHWLAGAPTTAGASLLFLAGGVYARYVGSAARDLVTEYAERTGWVVNNPNPLGFLWNDLTRPPNVVTGWKPVGRLFGLRNPDRPLVPIPLPPPATPDEVKKHDAEVEKRWEEKGFASSYAGTDVHEDFAEAVTALALGWSVIDTPAFAPRREWIIEKGFWPRKWEFVEQGRILDAWARDNGRPLPNVYDWAVNFGLYSGRPPEKARLTVTCPQKPRITPPPPAPGGPVAIMSVEGEEEPAAGATVPEPAAPAPAELGEGDAMEYSGDEDELRWSLDLARDAEAAAAHHAAHEESLAPALARVREVVEGLEAEFRSGAAVELLRAAERRGDGVLFLGERGVEEDEQGAFAVPGRPAEPGDVVVAAGGALYLVVGTDAEGRVTRLAGEPEVGGGGGIRGGGVRGKALRYFWSPGREPRAWTVPGGPMGEYADLPAALAQLVGLWGEREGRRRGSDLSVAGDFAAEVLTAAGLKHRGLAGSDGDGVRDYLDGWGEGVRPLGRPDSPAPAAGDLVRLRREGLWGVCTRARRPGEPLDVLFQGGLAGHAGEEEDAAVLRHSVEPRRLGHLWRPAAARRARG
ncbi:MAG TPA: hypothetical protein VF615_20230 [Longimicrobiaceae bacterium]|jgi:hypothetical protein